MIRIKLEYLNNGSRILIVTLMAILIVTLIPVSVIGSTDYEPPIGIPSPSFGIEEPTYSASIHCPNWPLNVNSKANGDNYDCYYIDNSVSCTDSGNLYGYPDNPRCTLPEGSLSAGAFVDVRGGVTTPYTAGGDRFDWTGTGTPQDYILITGKNAAQAPILSEFIHIGTGNSASYMILENMKIKPPKYGISLRPTTDGHDIDHISLRNLEIRGTGNFKVCSSVSVGLYNTQDYPNSETSNVVVYNVTSYDSGQWNATSEDDCSSFYMQGNSHYFWVLDSLSYRTGGDSVAGGHAANRTSSHYYIGGNNFYQNRENGIDIKEINNIVISGNTIYNHRPIDSAPGEAIVIHYGSHSVGPNEAWVIFNTIHDNENGIVFTMADNAYIIGNLIYEINHTNPDWNPTSAYSNGAGIHIRGVDKAYVTGNTLYGYDTGIQIPLGSSEYHIENNILSNRREPSGYEVHIASGATSVDFDYNLFHYSEASSLFGYDSSSPRDLSYLQGVGVCLHCLEDDPLFADTGNNNFELVGGSPAIDTGMVSSVYQTFFDTYGENISRDMNGIIRPQGSAWDIGAYEYQSVSQCQQENILCVDDDPGPNQEFSSIQSAADIVQAGDTVIVFPGTYNERIRLPPGVTGSSGDKITFINEPRRTALTWGFDTRDCNYLRIEGFNITRDSSLTGWRDMYAVFITSNYTEIVDNYFFDISGYVAIQSYWNKPYKIHGYIANNSIYKTQSGIFINGDDWLIENNEVERLYDYGNGDCDYARFFGKNVTFKNNYFHGSFKNEIGSAHVDCFQTFNNNGEYVYNITIEANQCYDFIQGLMASAISGPTVGNITLKNNIFAHGWSTGINALEIPYVTVINNDFINISYYGIRQTGNYSIYKNNIFYNSSTSYPSLSYGTVADYNLIYDSNYPPVSGPHDLLGTDPLFMDAANNNYHPQTNSPVCDVGEGGSDIGAYECMGQTYHRSDTNRDGCVDTVEMVSFMDRWKISSTDVGMVELMESIGLWKSGVGCS